MADEYLTVNEIADTLKVHRMTVRTWISEGQLPAVRAGERRVRVRQADLDMFLTNRDDPLRARGKRGPIKDLLGDLQDQVRGLRARVAELEDTVSRLTEAPAR